MKNKRKSETMKIALCGIMAALCIVIMLLGFFLAIGTYAAPAMAAICLLPIVYEYGEKTAATLYLAISFLSFIVIPDYELTFMFVFVFGLYTVFKFRIDRMKNKTAKIAVKFLFINISVVFAHLILLVIFPIKALVSEFARYSVGFIALLMIVLNITFFVYDKALEKILVLYVVKFRKRIFK